MRSTPPHEFFLGVNYPWLHYGQDFGEGPWGARGTSSAESVRAAREDFAGIAGSGASVVRWFVFCDGRGGFAEENGIATGPDELLFRDVETSLGLANEYRLKICFSLADFHWLQKLPEEKRPAFPRSRMDCLRFPAGREAFLDRVLIPLFREFARHPGLFAWEIANEPEWAIHEFCASPYAGTSFADFRAFAEETVKAIHEFGKGDATMGSARLMWMRAWAEIGLDWHQAHYYPMAERDQPLALGEQLSAIAGTERLEQPVWLGELPVRDESEPGYKLEMALDACRNAGLAGAAVWRWRKPEPEGADARFGCADPAMLQAWLTRTAAARA